MNEWASTESQKSNETPRKSFTKRAGPMQPAVVWNSNFHVDGVLLQSSVKLFVNLFVCNSKCILDSHPTDLFCFELRKSDVSVRLNAVGVIRIFWLTPKLRKHLDGRFEARMTVMLVYIWLASVCAKLSTALRQCSGWYFKLSFAICACELQYLW